MWDLLIYILVSFLNVFLHIGRSILVIKAGKLLASSANCVTYTFSAVVVKYITEYEMSTVLFIAASTNFFGCWLAMKVCELEKVKKLLKMDLTKV